jgi:hypothetical protein
VSCIACGVRNSRLFEDVEVQVGALCRNVLNMLYLWVSAHSLGSMPYADFFTFLLVSVLFLRAPLYTSCVLGLRPSALFNEFLLIKKKKVNKGCEFLNYNYCSITKGTHEL